MTADLRTKIQAAIFAQFVNTWNHPKKQAQVVGDRASNGECTLAQVAEMVWLIDQVEGKKKEGMIYERK